jgi:hypothetical protein
MEQLRLFWFYQLAQSIHNLHNAATSDHKLDHWRWKSAIENTADWLKNLEQMSPPVLPKTMASAGWLSATLGEFSKLLGQSRVAESTEYTKITSALVAFNNILEQELEDAYVFFVTPAGAYSVSALIEVAEKHLSPLAQKFISKEAKMDFQKAGTCLALDWENQQHRNKQMGSRKRI